MKEATHGVDHVPNPFIQTKEFTMTTETNTEIDPMRILKTATCSSLSGKSNLTYNIGCDGQSEIQFQVAANDGGGYFNCDWVSQSSVRSVFDKLPKSTEITSATLRSLYPSKSTNSPGFLLAVLKSEGLVRPLQDKRRGYELLDPSAFTAEVNALMESPADADPTEAQANASNATEKVAARGRLKKS
jgi:hypothetical protein